MEVQVVPKFGLGSPASINHDGVCERVLVDPIQWIFLPKGQKEFIVHHELAHCKYNVFSETEADRIGLENFINNGGCAQDAIDAVADNLDTDDPFVQERIELLQQYSREMYPTSYFGPNPEDLYDEDPAASPGNDWDWNNFFGDLMKNAPGIINSVRGNQPYNPNSYNNAQTQPKIMGMEQGTFVILAIAIIIIMIVMAVVALKK